ncbi:bifunctional DNA primase/polymerase [Paenibacillus spiritus]|uniref:Bifunctional DNA primase/polymerase n=1 Tax=Paenibacillus spiritus TaxID=2496557 RepID=A0A5J5GD81_9BACL|nr:bifunctional DNA primase/polymerase [Paenibacillus spiritus]KAA9005910.1 bifunctional DNA primase/polymerase [Paenibacillus spiritus]
MIRSTEPNLLTANALNTMTPGEAAEAMASAKVGPKYLPVCPPDHQHVSKQHAATCMRPGKAPTIGNWREKASDDLTILQKWFGRHPNRNLGMTLGGEVGIVGFDVDGEYGKVRMEELFDGNIPETWQFSTPGDGMRFLFSVPKDQRIRKLTDALPSGEHQELALLADGQMTVLPPSLHGNGGQYRWMPGKGPGDVPLAALPEEVLTTMRTHITSSSFHKTQNANIGPAGRKTVRLRRGNRPHSSASFTTLPDPDLQKLAEKCHQVQQAVDEQACGGCHEERWHMITSMLVKAGYPSAALAFSELSEKHDNRSEIRIQDMDKEREVTNYGPTRCVTLGCNAEQIASCQGSVRKNQRTKTPSNTPVTLLSVRAITVAEEPTSSANYANLIDNKYALNNDNLCAVRVNGDGSVDFKPLANFVARIAKSVMRDDGAERTTMYEIDGVIISSGKKLSPVRIPASEFENMKWLSMWGPEPNILPGNNIRDSVRHAIQSTAPRAENKQVFAHLGWIKIDSKWKYLHAGGAIGHSGIEVELEPRLTNYLLPETPFNPQQAMIASIKLLDIAPRSVTLVLWSLIFLTPLCEILRQVNLEPKFLVWLHGYTGSRKTSIAKLFLCHFGNLLEHPTASFKDTANSVEKRGFDTKDSLLLIDDYHPTSSPQEGKKMEQLAQQVLRGYGDRVGRGRMKQDTSLRPDYPPRGMAIITAEDMLGGASSVARLFPAELGPDDVNLKRLTRAQQKSEKLSEAMAGYIMWLEKMMNSPRDHNLKDMFVQKRNSASNQGVHGRLVEASGLLHIGLHFGLEYAESVGAIEASKKRQLLEQAWELFLSAANEQGEKVNEVKATTRFMTIVSQLLANHSVYCDKLQATNELNLAPRNGIHVGWHDDTYYYFLPDLLYNTVNHFLSKQGEHFPISSTTLWKELAAEGLLYTETYSEKGKQRCHRLVKKTVHKQRQRLLWLKRQALHDEAKETMPQRMKRKPVSLSSDDLKELDL